MLRFHLSLIFLAFWMQVAMAIEPIPDKLVVLTFDDAVKSHYTVVRPILLKHGFGATFFVTEGFDFKTNKDDYMTWKELAQLHDDRFEIGNHTRDHLPVTEENLDQLAEQLKSIRKKALDLGISRDNFRPPTDEADLRDWLENMAVYHRYATSEMCAATGLPASRINEALAEYDFRDRPFPKQKADEPITILPYPGGRHPRIGFLDGAIRPQRDTKFSVFAPWNDGGYFVVDLPEAIWIHEAGKPLLLYLAHTHIPSKWESEQIILEPIEWTRNADGTLEYSRTLPNQVSFGAKVLPRRDAVHMELWLTNETEQTLTGLRVQNCIMLRGAPRFAEQSNDNKVYSSPFAACRNQEGNRWVITAWERCVNAWGNAQCPCLHSDPQFADCPPGKTERLRGWLSFYEGDDIEGELQRIKSLDWRK